MSIFWNTLNLCLQQIKAIVLIHTYHPLWKFESKKTHLYWSHNRTQTTCFSFWVKYWAEVFHLERHYAQHPKLWTGFNEATTHFLDLRKGKENPCGKSPLENLLGLRFHVSFDIVFQQYEPKLAQVTTALFISLKKKWTVKLYPNVKKSRSIFKEQDVCAPKLGRGVCFAGPADNLSRGKSAQSHRVC